MIFLIKDNKQHELNEEDQFLSDAMQCIVAGIV
jgi:hypothetical protein